MEISHLKDSLLVHKDSATTVPVAQMDPRFEKSTFGNHSKICFVLMTTSVPMTQLAKEHRLRNSFTNQDFCQIWCRFVFSIPFEMNLV